MKHQAMKMKIKTTLKEITKIEILRMAFSQQPPPFRMLRARLHCPSTSTHSQHCDDACNMALTEINGNR